MTLNINHYEEANKILTSSQSFGEPCLPSLIALEDMQDLYRVDCKVLNIFDVHDSEKDRNKIEEAMDKLFLLSSYGASAFLPNSGLSTLRPSTSGTLQKKTRPSITGFEELEGDRASEEERMGLGKPVLSTMLSMLSKGKMAKSKTISKKQTGNNQMQIVQGCPTWGKGIRKLGKEKLLNHNFNSGMWTKNLVFRLQIILSNVFYRSPE